MNLKDSPDLHELSPAEFAEIVMAFHLKEEAKLRPDSLWTEQQLSSIHFRAQCEATIERLQKEAIWRAAKRAAIH